MLRQVAGYTSHSIVMLGLGAHAGILVHIIQDDNLPDPTLGACIIACIVYRIRGTGLADIRLHQWTITWAFLAGHAG